MGYVLYSPINSSENLPPFQASIKDGYAIKYGNNWFQTSNIFNVVQVSVAGTVVSIYFIINIMYKHCIDII